MTSCWQNDPDARPTFTDLRDQLKDIETMHKVRLEMNITPMTFFSCKREWKLGCEHSLYRQWFIQTSEEYPLISTCWYNTEFFSIVSPWFHDGNSWKLSLRVLFSIEFLTISTSKILDNNRLCWLNKKALDDCKKLTIKLKWNSVSNGVLLSIEYFACFYYYELVLITSHDAKVETIWFHILSHIFFPMQRLINMKMYDKQLYANVEDWLV